MSDPELKQLLKAFERESFALKLAIAETERSLLAMRKRVEWLEEESVSARAKAVFVNEVVR